MTIILHKYQDWVNIIYNMSWCKQNI